MVILKADTEEIASDIAYMLRGWQYGRYVFLLKEDHQAIELAFSLTNGKLIQRIQPGMILMVIVFSLFLGHGFITTSFLSNTTHQEQEPSLIHPE